MSFSPRTGRVLQECCSALGWGEYKGVIQSKAGVTTCVLFSPRKGQIQECHSVQGWGEQKGVIQS